MTKGEFTEYVQLAKEEKGWKEMVWLFSLHPASDNKLDIKPFD